MDDVNAKLANALWRVYHRPDTPPAWVDGGNLPWDEPDFSERMLREHLDETHGAASRVTAEREQQVEWLWKRLNLKPGDRLLDVTCGPGLYATAFAGRGCHVTGIDFSPASISFARELAITNGVAERCVFIQQDVRLMVLDEASYDAALFIYGQLAVFPREEALALLTKIGRALKPDGRLCVELLNQDRVDKKKGNWWFSDDRGLWGDRPFLHLGERFWDSEASMSIERFNILHLETGTWQEIILCDQTYAVEEMTRTMKQAGFSDVMAMEAWNGLKLHDADEWVVYLAQR